MLATMHPRLSVVGLAVALVVFAATTRTDAAGAISTTNATPASANPISAAKDQAKPPAKPDAKSGGVQAPAESADVGGLFASQDNLVPLPTVIAPVMIKDRLAEHLYLFLAAITANAADAQVVKARLPYVQDAMVRDVYLHVVSLDNPSEEPDTVALIARLKTVINNAVGQPLVTQIQVGRIDTAPF
jgi:hypothetical protein